MKCNTKTMVTTALALALVIALGYWALPQFRGTLAPFILVACMLVCPLSMLLMMRGTKSSTDKHDVQSETVTGPKS
jgi:multisubunit Na+/H+ antiporter MnhG subunit